MENQSPQQVKPKLTGRGGPGRGQGRKTSEEESKKHATLALSWDVLFTTMNDPNIPMEEKVRIALILCPRTIKQETEHSGSVEIVRMTFEK